MQVSMYREFCFLKCRMHKFFFCLNLIFITNTMREYCTLKYLDVDFSNIYRFVNSFQALDNFRLSSMDSEISVSQHETLRALPSKSKISHSLCGSSESKSDNTVQYEYTWTGKRYQVYIRRDCILILTKYSRNYILYTIKILQLFLECYDKYVWTKLRSK